jgi:hypothetical protein
MSSSSDEVSYWIGTAVSAVAVVVYAYYAIFPRRPCGEKIALWMMAPAIACLISQSSLLLPVGYYLRSDGVEFNYVRWIYFTISLLITSAIFGSYAWDMYADGWALMAWGLFCGVLTTLAGLVAQNWSWPLVAFALANFVVWVIWLFMTRGYTAPQYYVFRRGGSKLLTLLFALLYTLSFGLAWVTYFLSNALVNVISTDLATWLYFAAAMLTLVLPLIVVFDYETQPDLKQN